MKIHVFLFMHTYNYQMIQLELPVKVSEATISTKGITTTVSWFNSSVCQHLSGYYYQVNYTEGQRWYVGCSNITTCSCIMSRHIMISSIEIVIKVTNEFGSTSSDRFFYYMASSGKLRRN